MATITFVPYPAEMAAEHETPHWYDGIATWIAVAILAAIIAVGMVCH